LNVSIKNIFEPLFRLNSYIRGRRVVSKLSNGNQPLRAELFSADQMEQYGRNLAGSHQLSAGRSPDQLLGRLAENEAVLLDVRNLLTESVKGDRLITPAGEWLLDNFYLIEEQIRTARRHLPKGYSRELPRLEKGSSAGLPRVYDIATEIISHGDGRADPESLSRFVAAYQGITPLKLGELWAIPIMLRLALIENLRRIAVRIAADRVNGNLADDWADRLLACAAKDQRGLILVIADMARSDPPLVSSFVAELTRRLQGQGPALALPLNWIEQRLAEEGQTIKQLVDTESHQQAADQVSISNSIDSLRFLGAMDWREFVETMSIVNQVLSRDTAHVYSQMDFSTRDRYRHVVEEIAGSSNLSEIDVARLAVGMAGKEEAGQDDEDRRTHVGFYLVDKGLAKLKQAAGIGMPFVERLRTFGRRFPFMLYSCSILLSTLFFAWLLLMKAQAGGLQDWQLVLLGLLLVLAVSQPAIAVVNWLATLLVTPHPLPRMDFSKGIPTEFRTLTVVPTMLTGVQNIAELTEALEVRFLANRDDNLHFALLTDFLDAPEEVMPGDDELLRLAREGIEGLNVKYGNPQVDRFFLFHRPRRWNPRDRVWMGYERKRGKLADLNALLRGDTQVESGARFSLVVGETSVLSNVRYVITLDTDTQLPRDAARLFVGAMAHPLNRPRYDRDRGRVCEGYGILQPRVAASMQGANRSRYAALFGSDSGIDPYTRVVSDVYQDLFGEGSFIGKGIYDVDAFEQALEGRFPENLILSHDLVEGCHVRSGLLSDAELYEEPPSRYSDDVIRRHRWIRGDWQLIRWLMRRVPGADESMHKNPLTTLSQWKLLDNLRRSIVPVALTGLLLLAWAFLLPAWFWTFAVLGIIFVPALLTSFVEGFRKPDDLLFSQHLSVVLRAAGRSFAQTAVTFICLPYEAFFSLDAIVRTLWRMGISHRRLLEWNPSSNSNHGRDDLIGEFRIMWFAPVLAVTVFIALCLASPGVLVAAVPIVLLWFLSPVVTWWISQPLIRREARLTKDQTRLLRKLSRKTWAFFETFVGPDDNWLPPDNFQEHPLPVIAHRTSPTNLGLSLLANLSAYDFGYIPAGQLIKRTQNAFATMESMERYQGHFYNWYDTQSLKPLTPLYVSSVDSGNLSGYLLTLRPGLLAISERKILEPRLFEGLVDTLHVLSDVISDCSAATPGMKPLPGQATFTGLLKAATGSPPVTPAAMHHCLEELTRSAAELADECAGRAEDPESQLQVWSRALLGQCRAALDELSFLVPWSALRQTDNLAIPGSGDEIPTLRQLADMKEPDGPSADGRGRQTLRHDINQARRRAGERIETITRLAEQCEELGDVEYGFLFDKARDLVSIGYNVSERRQDEGFYDLLASEARFGTFVAIARGKLPQESWFALGRLLTTAGGKPTLLSWSGSMFEYLMPLLVMPTYEHTLLNQTMKAAVFRQIEYGRQREVPWGSSESGYNAIDVNQNYQYRAFGVPGLGLKRGLDEDLVIAPYASAMALMVAPEEACRNLEQLEREGFAGQYGFYEAVDYTPSRLPRGESNVVVRSFMTHHQGMSILALAYLLLDRPMQKRFESEPLFQATLLLLQERIPTVASFYAHTADHADYRPGTGFQETPIRVISSQTPPVPEVQLLSNGSYHVMVTSAGGGYSRWKDMAVTRWREDSTSDPWGTFCYLRDEDSGAFWSTAGQPVSTEPDHYEAIFSEGRAEFRRLDHGIDTHTEIAVSPEDDIELRHVTISNKSGKRRTIDVTSYAEVVMAPPAADELHPAFGNLFVQTEILRRERAIFCTRRPRSKDEPTPCMFHLMSLRGNAIGEISYETDRAEFVGRGNTVANPRAMTDVVNLTGSEGSVLDPIVAIRYRITLEPYEKAIVSIVTGVSDTRDAALAMVEKYQDRRLADRVFSLAWTHSQVLLRQINAGNADAQLYGRLAGSMIHANASLRADAGILLKNSRGQSDLWGYSISGDLPILLLTIEDPANIELVRQLAQAHAYWRLKGLSVDLVIWNEDHAGYRQLLHDQIMGIIGAGIEASVPVSAGSIYVRSGDQISEEDRILIQTVARAIITDGAGSLAEQLNRRKPVKKAMPVLTAARTDRGSARPVAAEPRHDLMFFNGFGGFTHDGREYVISTAPGQVTPAPWVNILANPDFGTVVSESGSAYTWAENAHEFRLTPWYNDPVTDQCGEAFYIRDEDRGHYWSPMPLPSRGMTPYVTRHGFGYSVFEHRERGICSEVWVYVAIDSPVKFTVLKIKNESERSRRLSVTGFVEWVLGDLPSKSAMHVVTELDPATGALFARNPFNTEFPDRTAFFNTDGTTRTVSGDRTEFLGRNGALKQPEAMKRTRLSGMVGAAMDPCAAIQASFELEEGQEREIVFTLGAEKNPVAARRLAQRFQGPLAAREALESVWQYWKHTLGAVQVQTPDPSLDVLVNGWLLYQTLACRLWARSGYYQSGGAFGFRDQLQDVMALIHAEPGLVRKQLLLCASRQFPEGDVQHWWHPPAGRGVRTRCSDDYLWLPMATCRYVIATEDRGVLEEVVPFIQGRPINPEEDSYYDLPSPSGERADLYEHCVRAIRRGLRFGVHGLPLMGSGDWNDGMDLVGAGGKGESVWLGFFLYDVLTRFAPLARARSNNQFADLCDVEAEKLRLNIERNGWDGEWYRRAYFDDGTPLGSSRNEECQIDCVAQGWSVLSGAADPERGLMAMDAVDQRLVRRDKALIQLLDPPFDTSSLNPGYIKGYVPGVRENGGQYTHGAIWAAMAFASQRDARRAWELVEMINPVRHGDSPEAIATYKTEPYVIAADVYAVQPHTGRGGWSWYTGSAGWFYRLILESLLGVRLEADRLLYIAPCLPEGWQGFTLHYRYRETVYHISAVNRADGDRRAVVSVDGVERRDLSIPLRDDRQEHTVEVRINAACD